MITMLLAAGLMAAQPAAAEPPVADPAVKPHYPTLPVITQNEHLYEAFGGKEGLTALMDDAMNRWLANPRTRPFFANADQARIRICWSSSSA
jgi:hemoglobin